MVSGGGEDVGDDNGNGDSDILDIDDDSSNNGDSENYYKKRRKEGNVLINNTLKTFYLWLYGIRPL